MNPKLVGAGLLIGALACAAALIVPVWRDAEIAATHSVVAGLLRVLERRGLDVEVAAEWRVLSDPDYDGLMLALDKERVPLDACPQCHTTEGMFGDTWGNRLQVALRRSDNGKVDIIVWSKGPDRVSGTADDIVVPVSRSKEVTAIVATQRVKQ